MLTKLSEYELEAGTDEVGRGCLAGPVVAAAVILKKEFISDELNDSKQLTEHKRLELEELILNNCVTYAIAEVQAPEIDKINILKASIRAMHLALDQLTAQPEIIAVDGNKFYPYKNIPYQCVVKGDSKILSIAAASILAKNYRDRLMKQLAAEFPYYGWENNMGYATKKHYKGIEKHGICSYHRKSFKLTHNPLGLFD